MTIYPRDDAVLVRQLESSAFQAGSILTEALCASIEGPCNGEVIAVGPGARLGSGVRVPLDVHVGDRILFDLNGANEIVIEGEPMLLMRERQILGILGSRASLRLVYSAPATA